MKISKSNDKTTVKGNKLSDENLKDKLLFGDGTTSKDETIDNDGLEDELDKEFALLEGMEGMYMFKS